MPQVTVMTIDPFGTIDRKVYDKLPGLDVYQKAVGGYIEAIPGFTKLMGQECVAFCNEEGKLEGLDFNMVATALWQVNFNYQIDDVLVGTIVIIYGDKSLMEEL